MDAPALRALRRSGGHLSAHDVRHHGARCAWLLRRTSRAPGGAAPVQQPDDDDGERFFFEPCFSPLWDTAIAAYALGESEEAPARALRGAADWLLEREIRRRGDWSVMRPNTEPSGWAFEYSNDFYPDIDDTAMVLLALKHARATDAGAQEAARRRAVAWLLAMQSSDGGWAAFDVDNNWEFLSNVPFADHNAMLDPTCADITGRVMEGLVAQGVPRAAPRHPDGRRLPGEAAGGGRELVRALGSGLRLRHLLRAARPGGGGRKRPRSARASRRRMAPLDSERRRRLGRKLRELRQRMFHAGPQHAFADGLGADGAARRRRYRQPHGARRHRTPGARRRTRMEAGTRTYSPEPAFPGFSTSPITCTATTSP